MQINLMSVGKFDLLLEEVGKPITDEKSGEQKFKLSFYSPASVSGNVLLPNQVQVLGRPNFNAKVDSEFLLKYKDVLHKGRKFVAEAAFDSLATDSGGSILWFRLLNLQPIQ